MLVRLLDRKPSESTLDGAHNPSLTEKLNELQASNVGVADAVDELNKFFDDSDRLDVDGEFDAETAVDEDEGAVAVAEEALEIATDAYDEFVESTVADVVAEDDGSDLASGLSKYLGSTAKLTAANLQAALEGAQAAIDADTAIYDEDGNVATAVYSYADADGVTVYTGDPEDDQAGDADIELVGYVTGEFDADAFDVEEDLVDTYTVADLQDAMLKAETSLETARNKASDADLLGNVAAAISAYIGAGGNNVGVDQNHDLLSLRADITNGLEDADADITLSDWLTAAESALGIEDLSALADGHVTDLVTKVLAVGGYGNTGYGDANISDAGVVSLEDTETPTTGAGTWTKGAAGDVEGSFVWTYKPSAEEQALINAINALGNRADLITTADATEAAFLKAEGEDGNLGNELAAIEQAIADLAGLEQAVSDAQGDLDTVTELSGKLQTALDELAEVEGWFEEEGYELPVVIAEDVTATEASDIFLFADAEGEAFSITDFGAEGNDVLYFAETFQFVGIGEQDIVNDRVGDVEVLEIFWQQDGDDVVLYIEADAAAGYDRGEDAFSEITTITLTGVDGSQLNLENGFLGLPQVEVA